MLGQFALMIAVAVLGLIPRHEPGRALPWLFRSGLTLLVVAAICGVAGALALRGSLNAFPKPSATTRFIQNGIYRLVRHPLALGDE